MKLLERLPEMTEAQLKQVSKNAQLQLSAQPENAQRVIDAVAQELAARKEARLFAATDKIAEIRRRMQGASLHARVIAAFTEFPPRDWERDMIRVLCRNPGATTYALSEKLGYSSTYFNWFGVVCNDRAAWLQQSAGVGQTNELRWKSEMLVVFGKSQDASTWTFKEEAAAAFRELGLD